MGAWLMMWLLKLSLALFVSGLVFLVYVVVPEHEVHEIPELASVPVPERRPLSPFDIAEINRMLIEQRLFGVKVKQSRNRGNEMCAVWKLALRRVPGYPMPIQKPVPTGVMPCRHLEGGSLSWIMNGKDL
jgi:hypothetical protein